MARGGGGDIPGNNLGQEFTGPSTFTHVPGAYGARTGAVGGAADRRLTVTFGERHVPSSSPFMFPLHSRTQWVVGESGSQKVQHHFGGFKHKSETISITKMVNSENSSDLERVAATRSIAVKFSEFTILVIELQRCENTAFHFHAAPFGIRTP